MSGDRPAEYLASLVHEFCALPRETEWVESKVGEAVEAGLIVIADSEVGTRIRSYLPFWAAPRSGAEEVV